MKLEITEERFWMNDQIVDPKTVFFMLFDSPGNFVDSMFQMLMEDFWEKRAVLPMLVGFPSHAGKNYRTGKCTAVSDLRAEQQLVSPPCQARLPPLHRHTPKNTQIPNVSDDH